MNKVFITGRLTREPEKRRTQSGTLCAVSSLAVDQAGGRTDFVDLVAWRQKTEIFALYKKGQFVVIEGSLANRSWTDKAGRKQVRTEVVVDDIHTAGFVGMPEKPEVAEQFRIPDDYGIPDDN